MYDATFKILILSGPGVDKTGIVKRFLTSIFDSDTKLTIGVDFRTKTLLFDNQKVKLQVWDFSNEERFKFLLPSYLLGANGALFIYNIIEETLITELHDWINKTKSQFKLEKKDAFPIILMGNKHYLVKLHHNYPQEGIAIGKLVGVNDFIVCSTRTGENVEFAFETLTRLMFMKSGYELGKRKEYSPELLKRYPRYPELKDSRRSTWKIALLIIFICITSVLTFFILHLVLNK